MVGYKGRICKMVAQGYVHIMSRKNRIGMVM